METKYYIAAISITNPDKEYPVYAARVDNPSEEYPYIHSFLDDNFQEIGSRECASVFYKEEVDKILEDLDRASEEDPRAMWIKDWRAIEIGEMK